MRGFSRRRFSIDRREGFVAYTRDGRRLELSGLSSGEQHELVLLYELLFRAEQDTLILIDEPELSLHIAWQQQFLRDLLKNHQISKAYCSRGNPLPANHPRQVGPHSGTTRAELMKSFLTGHDLANTVKMAHNQRPVTFLLVEGTTDVTFFARFTHTDRCEILACHGATECFVGHCPSG